MKKRQTVILIAVFLLLSSAAIFLLEKNNQKASKEIASILNNGFSASFKLASTTAETTGISEAQQIAELRKEVEELKKQQLQTNQISDSQSATELKIAKGQLNSLNQQLTQLKKEKIQPPAPSANDADLLNSWNASAKVAQVACQDNLLGSWQMGSGVLISTDGKILTNQHVIQLSSGQIPDYCIILFNKDFDSAAQIYKKEYRANVAQLFDNLDAAVLKIQDVIFKDSAGNVQTVGAANTFSYFQIAPSAPQIGESVYVVGYPESANFAFSVTKGIISNFTSDSQYFGTDAQIDRGNSGGAALNSSGQLIGLPTYKFVSQGDYRGYILNIQQIKL